jgi:undecaprenyl pyrophosphate phosphatase UppP
VLTGVALCAIGVALSVLLTSRPLRGIGPGLAGGGATIAFLAWAGPLRRERARALRRTGLLGVIPILVGAMLLELLTPRHTTARLIGDVVFVLALIALLVVLIRMAARGRA